ncbi:MAG: hypothetical protein HQL64_06900 [Magnetococcales bacterium]|nr:hypothetical protein [Magnetococcales bacterium]
MTILLSSLWLLLALAIGVMGARRKLGFWGYFFGSILLSPMIGLLLVLASDKKPRQEVGS